VRPAEGGLTPNVVPLRHDSPQYSPNLINLSSIPGADDLEPSNATPDDDAGDFRAAAPIGTTDPDRDGIMVPVDTAAGERGAPESPPWPSTAP